MDALNDFLDANPAAKDAFMELIAKAVAKAVAEKEAEKGAAVAEKEAEKEAAVAEKEAGTWKLLNDMRYEAFMRERTAIRRLLPTSCRDTKLHFRV